jgi:hypothetical protein
MLNRSLVKKWSFEIRSDGILAASERMIAIGVLGVSAACPVFCLLYSPLYLLSYLRKRWSFRRRRWVDAQEIRFYRYCFALLCLLGAAAILNPTTALVAFVVLAGSAPLLWRVIL